MIFVPGRLTNLLQPADVSWFASLKKSYRQLWNGWYINDNKTFTKNGNLVSPGYYKAISWLSKIWEELPPSKIAESFKNFGVHPHLITNDKISVNINDLHTPLREILKSKTVISAYIDDSCE